MTQIITTYPQDYGAFSIVNRRRVLIADEGGYGKTIQAIDAKKEIELATGERIKALIVCPNSAREHWEREIRTNYPDEKVVILDRYDDRTISLLGDQDFLIINYESLGNKHTREKLAGALYEMGIGYTILDEAHHVRSPTTYRFDHTRELIDPDNSKFVALLSATPGETFQDFYTIISMLDPETYPTPQHVERDYRKNPALIHTVLAIQMLRRSTEGKEPEYLTLPVTLSQDHEAAYSAVLETEDIDPTIKLDQLRKAALDPSLVDPKLISDPGLLARLQTLESSKYLELDRILGEAVSRGEKAVVFTSRFREGVTEKLQQRYHKYGALRIDGTIPASYGGKFSAREQIRELFQTNPDHKVLITNPETMGESVSLTGASYVVFLDKPYMRKDFYQCIKRLHRSRQQEKDVFVVTLEADYPLHPMGSIDVGISELLLEKERVFDAIMEGVKVRVEDGKLVSDTPVHLQNPVMRRLYTPKQQLRRIYSRMIENGANRGTDSNFGLLYRGGVNTKGLQPTQMAKELAEYFDESWEGSSSSNASQVLKQLIDGLGESADIRDIADLASGAASLSRALGRPIVNVDFNKEYFKVARENTAIPTGNEYIWSRLQDLPFEDSTFDLAVCSMSLHWLAEERTHKGRRTLLRERENAMREANRILRRGGYYLVSLPSYIQIDRDRFYQGLRFLGFDVVEELSGLVKATDSPDSNFEVNVMTLRKMREPSPEIEAGYFNFITPNRIGESRSKRRKGRFLVPQERRESCKEFAFYDPHTGLEELGRRLDSYLSKDISSEIGKQVDVLPTSTMDGMSYVVVRDSRKELTTFVPRARIERLLGQVRINHDGIGRKELHERDPQLYNELKRLKLLRFIPEK